MPSDVDALRDLNEKLQLERKLVDEIRAFNRRMVRLTIREFAQGAGAFNAAAMEQELIQILAEHYARVGEPFSKQLTDIMPDDIVVTAAEREAIDRALRFFYAARAPEQAGIITATNQRNIVESIDEAIQISQDEAAEGRRQTRRDIAVQTGANLSRKLNGRVTGIASLETQAIAEAAKATEAQVLTFQPPSVTGGTLREVPVPKEWVTMGDEVVRRTPFSHVEADSQEKPLNQPFVVSGQLLRWPGDTSLGASVANVINCRCSSVVDEQSVFAVRRERGELPRTDRTVSEQLLTSLGG